MRWWWWSDNFQFLKCSLFSRPNSSYLLSLPGSMFQMFLSGQPKPLICVPVGERVRPAGIHFCSLQKKKKKKKHICVRANNMCLAWRRNQEAVMVMGVLIPAGLQLLAGQVQKCGAYGGACGGTCGGTYDADLWFLCTSWECFAVFSVYYLEPPLSSSSGC